MVSSSEKKQEFKSIQRTFVIFATTKQEVGEEDSTQEAKYTVILSLFVQACILLSKTLITSSLREQQHCLVAKCFTQVNNEATAKQTVAAINLSSINNLFVPFCSFPQFSSALS